jgi:hypothetical protein
MIVPAQRMPIVIAMRPVDFRQGHNGLAATVQNRVRCGRPTFPAGDSLSHAPSSWFTRREDSDGQDARGPSSVLA